MPRLVRFLGLVILAVTLVSAGWWAGRVALEQPDDPLGDPDPVAYEVTAGSVGRSLRFVAVAEWPVSDLVRWRGSGVVTSVDLVDGDAVGPGVVVFSVDLRPVTVGLGAVPMFRDLAFRAEGPDVAQLQQLLTDMGFFSSDTDGVFDRETLQAVRTWQEQWGIPIDGVVRSGDVVFVPELPARVLVSEVVTVGASLSGGEVVLERLVGDPGFVVPLALEQRTLVPLDADVFVLHGSGTWQGQIGEVLEDDTSGELELVLVSDDGGALCGDQCSSVPLAVRTDYSTEIVVIPETSGPIVPVASILTTPDGSTFVRSADGSEIPILVIETANGLAVVDGVSVGDVILLPVTSEDASS